MTLAADQRFQQMELLPFPEPEPHWPGSAFSLCHHGPPSRQYRDCEECCAVATAFRERREAWYELVFHLWVIGEMIR